MRTPQDVQVGTVHQSNKHGQFTVIKYNNSEDITIRFDATGYECVSDSTRVRYGVAKDLFYPSVYGVGYLGKGKYKSRNGNGPMTKEYCAWANMLQRCYSEKFHKKQPTYKDCTVCDEWLNFQVFAEWFELNYPDDGVDYELDKDTKNAGNKVYLPETCVFISKSENSIHAHAKEYNFISPDGEHVKIHNLNKFSRENGLHSGCMGRIHLGTYGKSYKGWTKA